MKKTISLLCILFATFALNAQTIHWLTFIDTKDPNVGEMDWNGREILYGHFINKVNAALREHNYEAKKYDIYDSELSPQKCVDILSEVSCSPNDILVFYYIGHGTRSLFDNNPYPQMLMGQSNPELTIPLKWAHEQLLNKQARLTVSIGMCCNSYDFFTSPKNAPRFAKNYGHTQMAQNECESISNLFLGNKGHLIVSSSTHGQASYGDDTPYGKMDFFTASLISFFENTAKNGTLTWNTLLSSVRNDINNFTQGWQTPFWYADISSAPIPVIEKPKPEIPEPVIVKQEKQKPQVKQEPQIKQETHTKQEPNVKQESSKKQEENVNALADFLSTSFDRIINTQFTRAERSELAKKLRACIADGTIVRTISQDGNLVVHKENIDDFLGMISTNRVLLKVIPESVEDNGDKINAISVKLIFKQKGNK